MVCHGKIVLNSSSALAASQSLRHRDENHIQTPSARVLLLLLYHTSYTPASGAHTGFPTKCTSGAPLQTIHEIRQCTSSCVSESRTYTVFSSESEIKKHFPRLTETRNKKILKKSFLPTEAKQSVPAE